MRLCRRESARNRGDRDLHRRCRRRRALIYPVAAVGARGRVRRPRQPDRRALRGRRRRRGRPRLRHRPPAAVRRGHARHGRVRQHRDHARARHEHRRLAHVARRWPALAGPPVRARSRAARRDGASRAERRRALRVQRRQRADPSRLRDRCRRRYPDSQAPRSDDADRGARRVHAERHRGDRAAGAPATSARARCPASPWGSRSHGEARRARARVWRRVSRTRIRRSIGASAGTSRSVDSPTRRSRSASASISISGSPARGS